MKQITAFDQLFIEYNTGPIPPPFCHCYSIVLEPSPDAATRILLDLEYFDREELTEEEIYDEGFTPDDNFKWEGKLPAIWMDELRIRLRKTNWKKKPAALEDGSEFIIKLKDANHAEVLQPADVGSWQIFCQEIIQVVFELAKKEAPLKIDFHQQEGPHEAFQISIEWSFSKRQVSFSSKSKKNGSIDWEAGQKMLKHIFSIDYLPENGLEKISGRRGMFIAPGDGLWYELDPKKQKGGKTGEKFGKLIAMIKKLE